MFNVTAFSPGAQIAGLVLFIIALAFMPKLLGRIYQAYQQRRGRPCPECGAAMTRLGEVQETQYLGKAQLLEQNLNVSDYGVWTCPKDGHVSIDRFAGEAGNIYPCNACGHHTMTTERLVKVDSTEYWEGLAILNENCIHCGYTASREVQTPTIKRPKMPRY